MPVNSYRSLELGLSARYRLGPQRPNAPSNLTRPGTANVLILQARLPVVRLMKAASHQLARQPSHLWEDGLGTHLTS